MSDSFIRFLLGIVSEARLAAMAAMSACTSTVTGATLDLDGYLAAKSRVERCDRLSRRLSAKRHGETPSDEPTNEDAESAFAIACRTSHASSENVVTAGARCACELDETAVRVHLALCYDVAWSSQHPTRSDNASPSVRSGVADTALVGLRPSDPPKWAREYANVVTALCEGAGCTRHFTGLDLDRELGKPVFTSSDDEKISEDAEAFERALFAEERMSWHERFEPRGEDALDRLTRAQRHERGLTEAAAAKERADAMNAPHESTVTKHEGSMRRRWATETPKGRRWVAQKQRVEKTKWQEFYRLARQLGRNPATPAAKGWVETVGMDAALAALREAVSRQPVAA